MSPSETIIFPTAYFPPISYFALLINYNKVLVEHLETFPKQTFRNRCEILTGSGKLNLVVPVSRPNGNHTLTRDIEICYRENWPAHHWKSIWSAYRSSPYFNYYVDLVHPLFMKKENSLSVLNRDILLLLCKIAGIHTEFSFTDEYMKEPGDITDYRRAFSPKKERHFYHYREYPQVFMHNSGFQNDLSILDLLFNLGPETKEYLKSLTPLS